MNVCNNLVVSSVNKERRSLTNIVSLKKKKNKHMIFKHDKILMLKNFPTDVTLKV